jgi:alpha-1,3-glucosyltransferase
MGDPANDLDGGWLVQMGSRSLGLFWCAFNSMLGVQANRFAGYQNPPMHGDYEAQRHWMEVTTQLPISQWYFHDLQWWGLDYPPLTAYHSWVLGKVGGYIDSSWFALFTSRGLEDPILKVFMRATVIVSEYLVYIPAAVIFVRRLTKLQGINSWNASIALTEIGRASCRERVYLEV